MVSLPVVMSLVVMSCRLLWVALPAAQGHLGGDTGSEPGGQAACPVVGTALVEQPAQRVQDDGAGDVAVLDERGPAEAERARVDPEELAQVVEDAGVGPRG